VSHKELITGHPTRRELSQESGLNLSDLRRGYWDS
jgi:hypothetical protein